jgi:hypothetical protein
VDVVVDMSYCVEEDVSGVMVEMGSMPSLRSLELPARCAERAVDAEAVYGGVWSHQTHYVALCGQPGEEVASGCWT